MLPPEAPLNSEERLYDTKTGHSRKIPETLINLEESADFGCCEPGYPIASGVTELTSRQHADGGT